MRVPAHHDREDSGAANAMTPMIDVVFLLLIFFVCASIGQKPEESLSTELAAGSLETAKPFEREQPLGEVWLNLRRRGDRTVITVNDREYESFEKLEKTLTQLSEVAAEIPVILDIGPEVPMSDMIRTYDTCRAAEFESIHFATDPRRKKEG